MQLLAPARPVSLHTSEPLYDLTVVLRRQMHLFLEIRITPRCECYYVRASGDDGYPVQEALAFPGTGRSIRQVVAACGTY